MGTLSGENWNRKTGRQEDFQIVIVEASRISGRLIPFIESIQAADEAILKRAWGWPGWAVPVFYGLTVIGGGVGLLVLVPWIRDRSSRALALWLLASVLVASGLTSIIKPLVGRVRPCEALGWCSALAARSPGGDSFPSGHAAGSLAFGTFIAVRFPKFAVPALLLSALIAWSRCVLGVHYPSDVIVGAMLGSAIGAVFAVAAARRERHVKA